MADEFDPYRKWLGIPPDEQPPHHYRLLGVGLFESDPDVIEQAADRQMAHVQTHKLGRYAPLSQKLLNQLAGAKLCLLNPEKKAAYDMHLRTRLTPAPPAAPALEPTVAAPIDPALDFVTHSYRAPRRKRKTSYALVPLALFVVVCAMLGGLYYKMYQSGQITGWLRPDGPSTPAPLGTAPGPEPAPGQPPHGSKRGTVSPTPPAQQPPNLGSPHGRGNLAGVIVDDDDTGIAYQQMGPAWRSLQSPIAYRMDYRVAPPGNGHNKARWSVSGLAENKVYEVFATWPASPDLASNAPFTVTDSASTRTYTVDQRVSPSDARGQGALWKSLGRLIPKGRLFVELSDRADGRVIADAVRVVLVTDGDSGAPQLPLATGTMLAVRLVDNRDQAFAETGDGWESEPTGHETSARVHPAGKGTNATFWQVDGLDAKKHYQVAVTWMPGQTRATNAPYSVFAGGEILASVRIDQQAMPDDAFDAGSSWKNLGVFQAPNGELSIRLTDEATGQVVADAVRVSETSDPLTDAGQATAALFAPPTATAASVPPPDAVRDALRQVKEMFKDDLRHARRPPEKIAVAEKLLQGSTTTVGAQRWVMLETARDMATQAGNLALVVQAEERLAAHFAIDLHERLADAVEKTRRETMSSAARKQRAEQVLALAERAISANKYDAALRLLIVAQTVARGTDARLVKQIIGRSAQTAEARQQYEQARQAAPHVQTGNDPAAHLTVGKYLCFIKNDWARGLPHLARSGDASLAEAARAELAYPRSPEEQLALADRWYGLAEQASATSAATDKAAMLARAQTWYEAAHPRLSGLSEAHAAKRLTELGAELGAPVAKPDPMPEKSIERSPPPSKSTASKSAPSKSTAAAAPGSSAPKTITARFKEANKQNTLVVTPAGGGHAEGNAFKEVPKAGGVLIGFNYTLFGNGRLASLQAIYKTSSGTSNGDIWGQVTPLSNSVVARRGYAVSGVNLHANYYIDSFEVVFAGISRIGMKPKDTYTSPLIGRQNYEPTIKISSEEQPVVGIAGTARDQITSLSLIHLPAP